MRALVMIDVSKDFAGVHAVRGVSVSIAPGEIVGVVGPNGSGKTTLVNIASGVVRSSGGQVVIDDRDLTGAPSTRFGDAGVVRTFQGLRLFEAQSAVDNVLVGAQRGTRASLLEAWVRTPRFRRQEREFAASAQSALEEVAMGEFAERPVVALSHGQRRRVELARAFAARPDYLVLDEPGAGLDPEQLDGLVALIARRRDSGVGVLLVEHDLGLVDRLADRVLGMSEGTIVAEGTLTEVAAHPALAPHLKSPR